MMRRALELSIVVVILIIGGRKVHAQEVEYTTISLKSERATLNEMIGVLRSGGEESRIDMVADRCIIFVKVSKRAREMTDRTRSALSLWINMSGGERILDYSRDEVEVKSGETSIWMPIDREAKNRIVSDLRAGQGAYLLVRPVGVQDGHAVIYIDYLLPVARRTKDHVLQDAIECMETLSDPIESLEIIVEMENEWSGTDWWREEENSAAIAYVRGLAHWKLGERDRAEAFLGRVEQYVKSHANDDSASRMREGLRNIGRIPQ
jgi:hypothetical protein